MSPKNSDHNPSLIRSQFTLEVSQDQDIKSMKMSDYLMTSEMMQS